MDKGRTNREWLHEMIDMISGEDLDMVKWLVQPYVARALNKKYKEEHKDEEA